ncbi:FecR family protein [Chitinophaga niabensis]|uniref:Ferric-dicitrate binding protein FerR, regulates iron transport through sigma-19 n=1 Tax=Chitinophaga niabensis TaxID=536979 RepID=A0A1N6JZS3_9BACT|nr:FecR domain-containing protein [Chitinophaga niabensis]SIO49556.1 ferric-dicitrate binding protein FerR, regulates iron transport through sigma-19 [Chitinophaga niabensis]
MEDPSVPQDPGSSPIRFRRKAVPEEKTKESWQQIETAISRKRSGMVRRIVIRALAAAVLLPLMGYAAYNIYCTIVSNSTRSYHTAYGEIKQVVLPDSSIVYLNANSTLRIPMEWDPAESRSVWLDGEAYFEITKKPGAGNAQFIVHTAEIDVAVLGTKFNVNMLGARTTVSLKEGKVQLTASDKVFMMKPGDEVQVEKHQSKLREAVNTELIADWRNHRYHFENTSIAEISSIILTKFGYEVVILNDEINHKKISGDLYAEDITQLSRALSITMNIQIDTKDNQLVFKNKE